MLSLGPAAGINVGKHFLDLGFHPAAKPLRCDNTPAGIERLIDALRQRGLRRVALEAIGSYAHPVTMALSEAGLSVALVDPCRGRAFRTAEGQIAKTDRLDAALIARFAQRRPRARSFFTRDGLTREEARQGTRAGLHAVLRQRLAQFRQEDRRIVLVELQDQGGMGFDLLRAPVAALWLGRDLALAREPSMPAARAGRAHTEARGSAMARGAFLDSGDNAFTQIGRKR